MICFAARKTAPGWPQDICHVVFGCGETRFIGRYNRAVKLWQGAGQNQPHLLHLKYKTFPYEYSLYKKTLHMGPDAVGRSSP